MKRLYLLPAILLACAAPAWAQQRVPTARDYAEGMQGFVGREMGAGLRATGVRAEGDVLVITVDGPAGWRREGGETGRVEAGFFSGFCEGDRPEDSIFDGRLGVRIDTTERGGNLIEGRVVTACPRASGA